MTNGVAPPEDNPDQGVAWHYGDPLREQRWLVDGTGVVDLANRGLLRVAGEDRLTWLHALTTQHLEKLAPHQSSTALILDPQGHVEFELHLIDDGSATWIICQPGQADGLRAYLESMRFMLRVDVVDEGRDYAVLWSAAPLSDLAWSPPQAFRDRGWMGVESILTRQAYEQALMQAAHRCGTWALEALRVAAGAPRIGLETDHRTIPNEVDWLNTAVHLQKGCYRGQETVAKVHNLGRPPRRLELLLLDGSAERPPKHGDVVMFDGREVGFIGTGVQHYELGPIASAIIKRSVPPDAPLVVRTADGDLPAHQDSHL